VLARKLAEGSADVPSALQAYEAERKERTAKLQNLAARLGAMGQWTNPASILVRETMMRVMYRTVALKAHRKDMAHSV